MRTRRWILVVAGVIVIGMAFAIAFDPSARLQGWMNNEPFYKGRSATAWRRDLREPDGIRPASAFDTLVAGGSESVPVCVWILRTAPEPDARRRAADVLGKIGPEAHPAGSDLIAALSDQDPIVRGVAIRTLGELAPSVPEAIPHLVQVFPDVDAIRAVSRYGSAGAPAVPRLIELLNHEDPVVRWQAARTLGKLRSAGLPAVPDLIRLTGSDPDHLVREHAAEALGDIGPPAVAGVPALIAALKDPVPRVRRDAVRALGQIGPAAKDALTAVRASCEDPDPDVQVAAIRAVRQIDPTLSMKK